MRGLIWFNLLTCSLTQQLDQQWLVKTMSSIIEKERAMTTKIYKDYNRPFYGVRTVF